MKTSDIAKVVGSLLVIGGAGFVATKYLGRQPTSVDAREFYFRCNKCKATFGKTPDEIRALDKTGYPLTCTCGSEDLNSGAKCKACGGFIANLGHATMPDACPNCKAPYDPDKK